MEDEGYRMANIFELLALPEIEAIPVAAMGSVWIDYYDRRTVPFFSKTPHGGNTPPHRKLFLTFLDRIWEPPWHVLGIQVENN